MATSDLPPLAIGIDFGTHKCVCAVMGSSGSEGMLDQCGTIETSAIVGLSERKGRTVPECEEVLVGRPAADIGPEYTIIPVRRLMGRELSHQDLQQIRAAIFYDILVPLRDFDLLVLMAKKGYSPATMAASIFGKLKRDVEIRYIRPVTHAVISVPAYFNEVQRDATRNAGVLAGLNVVGVLDEPRAAAIAFGVDTTNSADPKTILVYDLGDDTFDVSILMMADEIYAPLGLMGDIRLGGDNFDETLIAHVTNYLRNEYGIDATTNNRFLFSLKRATKEVKERLTYAQSAHLIVPAVLQDDYGNPIDVELEFTRDQYNRMISHLVAKTAVLTVKAVAKAGLLTKKLFTNATRLVGRLDRDFLGELENLGFQLDSNDDPINHVLMAGSSTRFPAVQEAMEQLFGTEKVLRTENPGNVVALGAAMVAERLSQRPNMRLHPSPT